MNIRVLSIFSFFFFIFLIGFLIMGATQEGEATAPIDKEIVRNSSADQNKIYFIPLRRYPISQLPLREEGCPENNNTLRKTLPWLGETRDLVRWGIESWSYDGNNMYQSGHCNNRYRDGGSRDINSWLDPNLYGGWAQAGVMQASSTPASRPTVGTWYDSAYTLRSSFVPVNEGDTSCDREDSSGTFFCTNHFGDAPLIWGWDYKDKGDQAGPTYVNEGLFRRNGHSNYTPNVHNGKNIILMSSGTSLFRNEFNLTKDELNRISSVTLESKADDFQKVYINGIPIAEQSRTPQHGTINTSNINKDVFQEGDNVIAIQVNDKSRWHTEDSVWENNSLHSNAVGLWYELTIALSSEAIIDNGDNDNGDNEEPSLSCTVEPPSGVDPLNVKVTVTENFGADPNGFVYVFDNVDGPRDTVRNRPNPFIFTLPGAGEYFIFANHKDYDGSNILCGESAVIVTDSGDEGRRERRPGG